MEKNYITKAIDLKFKEYEKGKISNTDLEKSVAFLLDSDPTHGKYATEEVRNYYNEKLKDTFASKVINVNKYSRIKSLGTRVALASMCATTMIGGSMLLSSSNKDTQEVVEAVENDNIANNIPDLTKVETKETVQDNKEKISSSLSFDPNDNKELVQRMTNFITDSLNSGIPVKEFMTDAEIESAKKMDATTIVTLEQLMDYYLVLNIEDIDPIDYARLQYRTKTVDTIMDNYMTVADEISCDLLTVDESNLIDYSQIVADKDSAKLIGDFHSLIAKYNTSSSKEEIVKEIKEFVNTNYITDNGNMYTMSANEQVYRNMFSFDILTNGVGITKDMGIILMEDRTYTCDVAKEKEIKNKSERAEEANSIRNIVEEKITESRKYYDQDLKDISEEEQKTGVQLENEIEQNVIEKKSVYVANPVFKNVTVQENTSSKSGAVASKVKGDNGKPIDQRELDKYNINPNDPNAKSNYEAAVEKATEDEYSNSPEHVIENPDGEVVSSGEEVNTEEYNKGFADGYFAGNNKQSSNIPSNASKSYRGGYEAGYKQGLKDREELDKSLEETTTFEPVVEEPEIVETDYEETPYEPTQPEEPEVGETFVPIEDGEEEIIEEGPVIEEGFVEMQQNNDNRVIEVKELRKDDVINSTNSIQLRYLNALKDLINESSKIVENTEDILNRRK